MIAEAMRFFGAEVLYYSRTRKPEAEAKALPIARWPIC